MSIPYFDAHCDTLSLCAHTGRSLRENDGQLDLSRLRDFAKAAQVFAIFADGGDLAECRRQRDLFVTEMAANADIALPCRDAAEIEAAAARGKIAALLSVEGGELLDCDPERLPEASAWGVRFVNLTWNHRNALAGSHMDCPEQGLTDRGRAFVRAAEDLGILLDVSHLSDRGFYDLADMASRPIVATHSDARAVCPHTRNLTDDMFRLICQSGGAAGLNLYADFIGGDALADVLRHIEHFLDLGGEKHLCLGGDLDGCDRLAGIRGVQDIPRLWQILEDRGYGRALLEDLFFNNLLRVLT